MMLPWKTVEQSLIGPFKPDELGEATHQNGKFRKYSPTV
jgi:hypothetical protein